MTGRLSRVVLTAAALVLGAVVLAGCGSGSKPTAATSTSGRAPAAPNMIIIKNFAFAPADLNVKPGATVTVKNEDSAAHTITATVAKTFDTGDITPGATKTFTAPARPGPYTYICSIHQYMHGTLTVT